MPDTARAHHARRVLDEHPGPGNPAADGLARDRYALIAHSATYKRDHVSGHPRVADALEHAAGLVLGEDGWWPQALVDLDSGETLAADGDWHIDAHVAIRGLAPAITTVTVNVTRHESARYELDGELTVDEALDRIRTGEHDPAWSRVHHEDLDVAEHAVTREATGGAEPARVPDMAGRP